MEMTDSRLGCKRPVVACGKRPLKKNCGLTRPKVSPPIEADRRTLRRDHDPDCTETGFPETPGAWEMWTCGRAKSKQLIMTGCSAGVQLRALVLTQARGTGMSSFTQATRAWRPAGAAARGGSGDGKVTVTSVPTPSVLETLQVPPCSVTSARTSVRPRPVPVLDLV